MGGVILSDTRGARLAIESDIHIADFPTATSCLANLQLLPNEFYNGLQVVAENIDAWRTKLVTSVKSASRSEMKNRLRPNRGLNIKTFYPITEPCT